MENSGKILRRSIHNFLQNYIYFTSTSALLVFPFSASVLLSQALSPAPSSLLQTISVRLTSLFNAAGFPATSQFFPILNHKMSQTITCTILTLPFNFTFLLIAKATIIQALNNKKSTSTPSFLSTITLYKPLLHTSIYNSILILSANATAFSLLFFAFSCAEGFGVSSPSFTLLLSASGAVLYSVILANVIVISNLALVLSGLKGRGGYIAILKACVLIRGRRRTSTALLLAIPANMGLAAIEALFHFRVVRAYVYTEKLGSSVALEGIFIAYLYSIFIVLDTVVNYMFYKSCNVGSRNDHDENELRGEGIVYSYVRMNSHCKEDDEV